MPSLGGQELLIILVIVVIIFGAGKLPEIGGAVGKSIKEFKAGSEGDPGASAVDTSRAARVTVPAPAVQRREVRAEEI